MSSNWCCSSEAPPSAAFFSSRWRWMNSATLSTGMWVVPDWIASRIASWVKTYCSSVWTDARGGGGGEVFDLRYYSPNFLADWFARGVLSCWLIYEIFFLSNLAPLILTHLEIPLLSNLLEESFDVDWPNWFLCWLIFFRNPLILTNLINSFVVWFSLEIDWFWLT